MDDYQKENYYVYSHKDPFNGYKIVYVGMGRRDRAWHCRGSQRREEHTKWLESLLDDHGYTMAMIVCIEAAGLNQADALSIEKELIYTHNPRFNLPMGCPKKLSESDIVEANDARRQNGTSYSELAEAFNVSTMTMWRALNG
jgi:hypothetical protein